MASSAIADAARIAEGRIPLTQRLAARGLDAVTALCLPAVFCVIALFIYPFFYGFVLSFEPKSGYWLANYNRFFSDSFFHGTIATTLWLAVPVTIINLVVAVPVALQVRHMRWQRLLTTILVLPITLGTVLVAEGLLNYLGPQGWFSRVLLTAGLISEPVKLVHNYWGVMLSLVITGFPFTFLLILSYVTGIDPVLEQAAATLGASARRRFWNVLLPLLMPGLAITFCLPGGVRGIRLLDGLRGRDDHGAGAARDRGRGDRHARIVLSRPGRRGERLTRCCPTIRSARGCGGRRSGCSSASLWSTCSG